MQITEKLKFKDKKQEGTSQIRETHSQLSGKELMTRERERERERVREPSTANNSHFTTLALFLWHPCGHMTLMLFSMFM